MPLTAFMTCYGKLYHIIFNNEIGSKLLYQESLIVTQIKPHRQIVWQNYNWMSYFPCHFKYITASIAEAIINAARNRCQVLLQRRPELGHSSHDT